MIGKGQYVLLGIFSNTALSRNTYVSFECFIFRIYNCDFFNPPDKEIWRQNLEPTYHTYLPKGVVSFERDLELHLENLFQTHSGGQVMRVRKEAVMLSNEYKIKREFCITTTNENQKLEEQGRKLEERKRELEENNRILHQRGREIEENNKILDQRIKLAEESNKQLLAQQNKSADQTNRLVEAISSEDSRKHVLSEELLERKNSVLEEKKRLTDVSEQLTALRTEILAKQKEVDQTRTSLVSVSKTR